MKKTKWEFSSDNSFIQFKVGYFTCSTVNGNCRHFLGKVNIAEGFKDTGVTVRIYAASVDTNSASRNRILKSETCLSAKDFPVIKFKASNGCQLSMGGIRELSGKLTIRGITQEITMVVSHHQVRKEDANVTINCKLFGCIKRADFNLSPGEEQLDELVHIVADIRLRQTKIAVPDSYTI